MFHRYDACMDVTESDHKPVHCKFHVKIAHVDRSERRQVLGDILRSNEKLIKSKLDELCYVPETTVSTDNIVLQSQDTCILRISNTTKDTAIYRIFCENSCTLKEDGSNTADQRLRGSYGFPRWLEVLILFSFIAICSPPAITCVVFISIYSGHTSRGCNQT